MVSQSISHSKIIDRPEAEATPYLEIFQPVDCSLPLNYMWCDQFLCHFAMPNPPLTGLKEMEEIDESVLESRRHLAQEGCYDEEANARGRTTVSTMYCVMNHGYVYS